MLNTHKHTIYRKMPHLVHVYWLLTYAYAYYLPWNTSWIKEVFVLTHVQGESLIHVGSIESDGGGNQSVRESH